MSNYPIWWDTTITVYNKFVDVTTDFISWHRTVLNNCFWSYDHNKINIGNTTLETSNTICRIPENSNYRDKSDWVNIPNDQMDNYFTLATGDIIVKGEISDIINEYISGQRSDDLIAKYKDLRELIKVESVSINVGAGRCNPHYLVKGV